MNNCLGNTAAKRCADENVAELARPAHTAGAINWKGEDIGGSIPISVLTVQVANALIVYELDRCMPIRHAAGREGQPAEPRRGFRIGLAIDAIKSAYFDVNHSVRSGATPTGRAQLRRGAPIMLSVGSDNALNKLMSNNILIIEVRETDAINSFDNFSSRN